MLMAKFAQTQLGARSIKILDAGCNQGTFIPSQSVDYV